MCLDLWFQLFPRPTFIPNLLSVRLFNSITHLSVPAIETEAQFEWLQPIGGSFSGLKQSPRVGHIQQTTKTSGIQAASLFLAHYL